MSKHRVFNSALVENKGWCLTVVSQPFLSFISQNMLITAYFLVVGDFCSAVVKVFCDSVCVLRGIIVFPL